MDAATVKVEGKGHHYAEASVDLRRELKESLSAEELRELHERRPVAHFAIVFRQLVLLGAATAGLAYDWSILPAGFEWAAWPIWGLLILVQGFTVFNFTVLLHEVVHDTVLTTRRSPLNRVLGLCYALPCGISASQFTRWHLDHHAELGDPDDDPKRHHLSPKRNARWYKLLYFTPALFFIYFAAAARENAIYPEGLRRQIRWERLAAIGLHLAIPTVLWLVWGPGVALRVHLLPVFAAFPIAFAMNRLGQHYDVTPDDPAGWSTLMKPSLFWDRAFLFSNYHLEHHYFPRVPCYNLPRLHRMLKPVYDRHGLKPRTYAYLLWNWLVLNRTPHTEWNPTDRRAAQAADDDGADGHDGPEDASVRGGARPASVS